MYTAATPKEIMATMLDKDFPFDKLSKPQYKVKVEKDVMVRMRDGVHVAVDIYHPDAPGAFPTILSSSPYQKDLAYLPAIPQFHLRETNKIAWFVERGYSFVNHDIRGSGKSVEGQWRFHSKAEQTDLYDVIEWIAEQPWSTGKVGMIGSSYFSWTQWLAAAQQPPHLTCIVPFDGAADMYRDVVFHGGIMAVGFPSAWHLTEVRSHYRVGKVGDDPNVGNWDLAWNVINHLTLDDFWKERITDLSKIKCPVFSIGMLHKIGLHLRGNVRGYEEINVPKKLMLCHGELDGDELAVFESEELRFSLLRWYDHWLKGNDTGMMAEAPVNIFMRGSDVYRREREWPLARTRYTSFYLNGEHSGAVESLNDGGLAMAAPTTVDSSTTYAYPDPDWSGFGGIGTAVMERGMLFQCKKMLTFTSAPLEKDLEIAGSVVLVLYASSDQADTDFFVRLCDQEPDAEQVAGMPPRGRILTRGWLKASHACTKDEALCKPYRPYYRHDQPQPIEPNKAYRYEIEIWPTTNCFKAGHRIRIELANGDSNAFDFGGHYYGLKWGQDTIYHDAEQPSHIILPVVSD